MATTLAEGAGILNETLVSLGYGQYQIDTTDNSTITAGFEAIGALAPTALSQVLSQTVAILVFRNYGLMFDSSKNPIRTFLRNDIEYGGGEEDIFHEILSPIEGIWAADVYTGSKSASQVASQLVDFYQGDIQKKFHTEKVNIDLAQSLSEYEIRQIFTPAGYARFVDVKMANLSWSAEYQLLLQGIKVMKDMIADQKVIFAEGFNPNTRNGVTSLVEALRTTTDGMRTPNALYNYSEVVSMSNEEDLFLVTTPDFVNRIQTRGYANAFNVEYYRNNNRLILLPAGTDLGEDAKGKKVLCLLVDRRAIVMSIMYWAVKPFVVSNTDYTNYFLKCKLLKGYNEFFNAVAFSGEEIGTYDDSTPVSVDIANAIPVIVSNDSPIDVTIPTEAPLSVNVENASPIEVTVENASSIDVNVTNDAQNPVPVSGGGGGGETEGVLL